APDEVLPTLQNLLDNYPALWGPYGFRDAFNPTVNWYDTDYLGIDEGPIVIMIENYRSESVWNRFMQNADIQTGLTRAGFGPGTPPVGQPGATTDMLFAIAPNPFRGRTVFRYRLASPGRVRLSLYDVRGREVEHLVDEEEAAGEHAVTFFA